MRQAGRSVQRRIQAFSKALLRIHGEHSARAEVMIDRAFCSTVNGLGMLSVGVENRDDGLVFGDGGQDLCRINMLLLCLLVFCWR